MSAEFDAGLVKLVWLNKAKTHLYVVSQPWPVAVVEVKKQGDIWVTRLRSEMIERPAVLSSLSDAMQTAADRVARRARYVWAKEMTGIQRYAVGHQQCPYWMASKVCGQTPAVGTIWCEWHPLGRPKDT